MGIYRSSSVEKFWCKIILTELRNAFNATDITIQDGVFCAARKFKDKGLNGNDKF
jgi:hypothetical protein